MKDTIDDRGVGRRSPRSGQGWRAILCGVVPMLASVLSPSGWGRNADLSSWAVNLSESSAAAEPGTYDLNPEIVVVGEVVHTVWFAQHPVAGHKVCYRRSTDRGRTWEPVKVFYRQDAGMRSPVVDPTERHLAVLDGRVHIAFGAYGDASSWYGQLVYLRSVDNGVTFQEPRVLWASGGQGVHTEPWHAVNTRVAAVNGRLAISYRRQPNWYGRLSAQVLVSNDGGDSFADQTAAASDTGSWVIHDFAMSDDSMAVMYLQEGSMELHAAVSRDGGGTFQRSVISMPSGSGATITYPAYDQHYTPSLWCGEGRVHAVWKGVDATDAISIFHRRSLDGGQTWGALQNLTAGTVIPAAQITSQDTLAGDGDQVWVLIHTNASRLYLRASSDGGATFGPVVEVTDPAGQSIAGDGWWPVMRYVPAGVPGGRALDIVTSGLKRFRSLDGGASFTAGSVGPAMSLRSSQRPQFAAGEDGTVHVVGEAGWTWYSTGVFGDIDVLYTRFDGQPAASAGGVQAVQLVTLQNQADGSGEERFDGVLVPDDGGLLPRQAFTVECWVRLQPAATDLDAYFLEKQGAGAGSAYETLLIGHWRTGRANVLMATEAGSVIIGGGPVIIDGAWHHVAVTYDATVPGTNFRVYVDGVEAASGAGTGPLKAGRGPLILGSTRDYRKNGTVMLDEVRLWDRALSPGEIAEGRNRPLTGLESGLQAWYPLEGSTRDASGHERHGSVLYRESFGPGVLGSPLLPGPGIVSSTILNAQVGQSVTYRIVSNGGATAFAATGLPAPLVCDPATGVISGVAAAAGVFPVALEARGASGTARLTLTLQIDGGVKLLYDNFNIFAVSSGPPNPTVVTLAAPVRITSIANYHYFNGGVLPGTIALRHENGTVYGPWQAAGLVGQGGVFNAYWVVWPMAELPAGTYTVVDSSPETWSWNSQSDGRGFSRIEGQTGSPSFEEQYTSWATNAGLAGAAAQQVADPDADRHENWVEQALGTHPLRPETAVARFAIDSAADRPVIRYRLCGGAQGVAGSEVSVNGTRVTLEVSQTMADSVWKASSELLDVAAAQRTPHDDGTETTTVPFRADRLNQGPWFVRERFTRLPQP